MRAEALEESKAQKKHHKGEYPEIHAQSRPHPERISCKHRIPVSSNYIVKRIQLQNCSHPWCSSCEQCLIIHDRAHPYAELKHDTDYLLHVLEEYVHCTCEVSETKGKDRCRKAVVKDLYPANMGHLSRNDICDQHDKYETEMHEKARKQLYDRKQLHREHHLFDEVVILVKYACYSVHGFTEKEPWHQSRNKPYHIACVGNRRCGLESVGSENKRIDHHRDQRLDEHPDNSEVGSHKTLSEIRLCKI